MNRKQRRAQQAQAMRASASTEIGDLEARFARAVSDLQAGRLQDAKRLLLLIPKGAARYPDSLHLIGLIESKSGQAERAVESISRAIAISPAEATYRYNRGLIELAQGHLGEAEADFRDAANLNPQFVEARFSLASCLNSQGRGAEAAGVLAELLADRPDFVLAQSLFCTICVDLGRLAAAAHAVEAIRQLRPVDPQIMFNLGVNLSRMGREDEAIEAYERVLQLDYGHKDAHLNLGVIAKNRRAYTEAVAHYEAVLRVDPDNYAALSNLGAVAVAEGRLEDAATAFNQAVALRPDFAVAHNNLATVWHRRMRLDRAIEGFERSIELAPDVAETHHNLALALLTRGDLVRGWREYEWRWRCQLAPDPAESLAPRWRGEDGQGKTLLVYSEQGLGDTIQFCRYAAIARECGFRVVLRAQKPLVGLLRGLNGVDDVISDLDALPAFDVQCPLLSLPLALAGRLDAIPTSEAYISADQSLAEHWARRLNELGQPQTHKVGLAWAGNPILDSDARRSIRPDLLEPLFATDTVQFVSLQKDGERPSRGERLIDPMAEVSDFSDTAGIIANLDLVISVDTSVAHLAGAMGKPVWLLNRFDTDWRWFEDRTDSPWYPSMRIYRQASLGDWGSVLDTVAQDLAAEYR